MQNEISQIIQIYISNMDEKKNYDIVPSDKSENEYSDLNDNWRNKNERETRIKKHISNCDPT